MAFAFINFVLYVSYRLYLHYGYAQKLRLLWRLSSHQFQNIVFKRCCAYYFNWITFLEAKIDKTILPVKPATITLLAVTVFAFGFQWYTLNYLPVVDCLPFKKGKI
jgi:hypothetical protein